MWNINNITDSTYRQKFFEVSAILEDWLGKFENREILDFGCGEATTALSIALRSKPKRVVAVDTHEEIENCALYAKNQIGLENFPKNFLIEKIKVDSPLYKFGTFDVIYAWSVFEHVSQNLIMDCLHKIKHALKPDGLFLFKSLLYTIRLMADI